MTDFNREMLELHLNTIKKEENTATVLIFKGFSQRFLDQISVEKLLSASTGISIEDLYNSKKNLLPEAIAKLSVSKLTYWITFEEYLTVGHEIISLYADVLILKNNIFHKTFPLSCHIDDIDNLYISHFENVDEYQREDEHPSLQLFSHYYGNLKNINSKYYITYANETQDTEFYNKSLPKLTEMEQSVYDAAFLELSEDEDEFLELIDHLYEGERDNQSIRISYSGDLAGFPYNYKERLSLLQELFKKSIKISLVTKALEKKPSVNEKEYSEILKKYWGFDSFRNLKMYKNVNDPFNKKETILVPQSQVIDDIVKQAEQALNGQHFNDVFTTSPTGAGKSVIFQVPAIYLAEKHNLMTIVISPLIGLMVDQVQGLQSKNVEISATINSEITPVQKLEIMEKIKEGKISILYISPETLLSRSDIKLLIGERRVGLFIIDEAHIVTTWGKAFRSDYWYLGSYLHKLRKEMKFPIATFTATAIYGGIEDMYAETRDSLNLINPISYFGYVKRDDLEVKIRKKSDYERERFNEYLQDKFKILLIRMEKFVKNKQKTLVYFPTVSLIYNFMTFAQTYGSNELNDSLACYFGTLDKEKKTANYLRYKNNEALVMLATKAFGMGIDIPDIQNVYHFAPTGNVCDYVQEIGRAARALETGYAYFDFLPKDFVHVNRLHGISTIRKHQLVQVLDKIVNIVENNKDKVKGRNLLVSSDEFRYIFQGRNNDDQNDDLDNKLKTALLIIEKDFKAKLDYSPIIARPRSLFANEYFMVQKQKEAEILRDYGNYFKLVRKKSSQSGNIFGGIYSCDMKQLWEDNYKSLSFAKFKFKFHSKAVDLGLPFLEYLQPVLKIELELKTRDKSSFIVELSDYIKKLSNILGEYARDNRYFSSEDISNQLRKMTRLDKYTCENLATVLLQSAGNYDRMQKKHANFYNRFLRFDETRNKYVVQNGGYAGFVNWIEQEIDHLLANTHTIKLNENIYETFLPKQSREHIEKIFVMLGIIEALDLILFRVNGGDNPEIYIRINSLLQLNKVVKNPARYENYVLNNVFKRHRTSVAMLTYLFENQVSTEKFWELIEDYFLGEIPEEVLIGLKAN